jgi:hypothetical protein
MFRYSAAFKKATESQNICRNKQERKAPAERNIFERIIDD